MSDTSLPDAIARAALDPEAWQGAMEAFAAEFPGANFVWVGYDLGVRQSLPTVYAGYDPARVAEYRARFARSNPYLAFWDGLPVGRVVPSDALIPERDVLRTEFWADWLRPQGDLRHALGVVAVRDPGRLFLFNSHLERRAAEGLRDRLSRCMEELLPRMRHSLNVNRMMMGLRLDSQLLREGVEPEAAGVLLLGGSGAVLHANGRAKFLLEEGRLLRCDRQGRLDLQDAAANARLQGALRLVLRPGDLSFRLRTAGGEVQVRLIPITPEMLERLQLPRLLLAPSPALLVAVQEVQAPHDMVALLRERLGVTPAEAEIVLALAEGVTPAEIAERRGVSLLTVRGQIKSAMSKAEVRRQSGLVRVVAMLRPPS